MKKLLIAAALAALSVSPAMAMSDNLLDAGNPANDVNPAVGTELPVPMADEVAAVHEFSVVWRDALDAQAKMRERKEAGEKLSRNDLRFANADLSERFVNRMDANLMHRVEFYKRAHNWNAQNEEVRKYNYTMQYAKDDKNATEAIDGYTNSYGWNVLNNTHVSISNALTDIYKMSKETKTLIDPVEVEKAVQDNLGQNSVNVNSEELRYYMNELVWFSAKQTVKDLKRDYKGQF